ncbi:MAG: hypothetical protein HKN47_10775 [Pirellulaceae bacterium]|nr:hypothetical protein [Pirellulaceae bacterium]
MSSSNLSSTNSTSPASSFVVGPGAVTNSFLDRRSTIESSGSSERRQFGSAHTGLSDAGRELALAIDQYKLNHHRRYITCDEMLSVLTDLGYTRSE